MRCIFCKKDSSLSRSVEHIVPESLGNTKNVLPAGVVCDRCNNYFAGKVEQPVLNSGAFKALRFHQAIPSKKNRIPPIDAVVWPDAHGQVFRSAREEAAGIKTLLVPTNVFNKILRDSEEKKQSMIVFPVTGEMPPENIMSRFLAKCAIEALAQNFINNHVRLDQFLVDNRQLDPIREHARCGQPRTWAFKSRMIYDANRRLLENGESVQTIHEYDFLFTTPEKKTEDGAILSELYFVLAIFGREFAINMGGPDMDGYELWLKQNNDVSPLYAPKNIRP